LGATTLATRQSDFWQKLLTRDSSRMSLNARTLNSNKGVSPCVNYRYIHSGPISFQLNGTGPATHSASTDSKSASKISYPPATAKTTRWTLACHFSQRRNLWGSSSDAYNFEVCTMAEGCFQTPGLMTMPKPGSSGTATEPSLGMMGFSSMAGQSCS